jgi:crotonobetainyl-CoA:carnitine CoA-transferase CaiB-like acyl-CoA transferase
VEHVEALGEALGAIFATRDAAHWIETLRAAAVPVGPINDVSEAWALAAELGLAPVDEATGVPNPPLRLSGSRPEVRLPPPALDAHGEEIRRWLKG